MRPPQLGRDVRSAPWNWCVNHFAASRALRGDQRAAVLRRFGLEVETDRVAAGCFFHSADIKVGHDALLNHGVYVENVGRVEIGARAALGMQVMIITSTHEIGPSSYRAGRWSYPPVSIGAGCWVGARAVILPGVSIGDGCVIAAGAVLRTDCEPNGLYVGVPARRVRDLS